MPSLLFVLMISYQPASQHRLDQEKRCLEVVCAVSCVCSLSFSFHMGRSQGVYHSGRRTEQSIFSRARADVSKSLTITMKFESKNTPKRRHDLFIFIWHMPIYLTRLDVLIKGRGLPFLVFFFFSSLPLHIASYPLFIPILPHSHLPSNLHLSTTLILTTH